MTGVEGVICCNGRVAAEDKEAEVSSTVRLETN